MNETILEIPMLEEMQSFEITVSYLDGRVQIWKIPLVKVYWRGTRIPKSISFWKLPWPVMKRIIKYRAWGKD